MSTNETMRSKLVVAGLVADVAERDRVSSFSDEVHG